MLKMAHVQECEKIKFLSFIIQFNLLRINRRKQVINFLLKIPSYTVRY